MTKERLFRILIAATECGTIDGHTLSLSGVDVALSGISPCGRRWREQIDNRTLLTEARLIAAGAGS